MQMIPSTASKYSADNMLDPEENLKAATSYLKKLTEMFEPYAADSMELMKFALAAYNAGEGRIKDCIALAESCHSAGRHRRQTEQPGFGPSFCSANAAVSAKLPP